MKRVLRPHRHGFRRPVVPFKPTAGRSVAEVLEALSDISFQGRSLGQAFKIWKRSLEDQATVYFGLSGAMTPAGLGDTIVHMIRERYIDVVVSTGANLFHDMHQSLGGVYFKCPPQIDDVGLRKARMNRMYDVVASDLEMIDVDEFIAEFAQGLPGRPHTTREFFYRLGLHLEKHSPREGILIAAAKAGVPVYCPAVGDSSFGIALAVRPRNGRHFLFDVVKDVAETGRLAMESGTTGVVFVGGGTPKNFTQQTWVTAEFLGIPQGGHKYCVQLTSDAPHWGGLSGCTFEESTSWGKIHFEANAVAAYVDATIGLPLLVQGLTDLRMGEKRKSRPSFQQGEDLTLVPAGKKTEKVLV